MNELDARTRILFTCSIGGSGHLLPIIEAARAASAAGHDVRLLVPPQLVMAAEREGIPVVVGDGVPRPVVDAIWSRMRTEPPRSTAGLIDRELFAGHGTRSMLPRCRELVGSWQPDLIVREPCEYAGAVAAHEAGIPQAQVAISRSEVEWSVLGMVSSLLDSYSAGLSRTIREAPFLTPFPAALDDSPWPRTWRFRRAPQPDPAAVETVRAAGLTGPGDPVVYVTLGSVAPGLPEARDVLAVAIDSVSRLPVRAIVTVGRQLDPESFGPVGDHVHIEQWVDQAAILPHAAAVVCHGGSGTMLGALTAGVPLVMCPMFADQPANAAMVQAAGAGVVVRSELGPFRALDARVAEPLRRGIERVIAGPGCRSGAAAIADELAHEPLLGEQLCRLLTPH